MSANISTPASGPFDQRRLAPHWSNEPELTKDLHDTVIGFMHTDFARWDAVLHFGRGLARVLSSGWMRVGGKTPPARPAVVAALIATLPPPLRDHVQDRYWQAL